jgi:hypothetical protein
MLFSPKGRVLGRIDGNGFKMIIRGATGLYSLGQSDHPRPYFVGPVLPEGEGSVVIGGLDLTPTRLFFVVWFGVLALSLPVSVAAAFSDPAGAQFFGVPLALMLFGALGFWWVRSAQERDVREIEEILTMAVKED